MKPIMDEIVDVTMDFVRRTGFVGDFYIMLNRDAYEELVEEQRHYLPESFRNIPFGPDALSVNGLTGNKTPVREHKGSERVLIAFKEWKK